MNTECVGTVYMRPPPSAWCRFRFFLTGFGTPGDECLSFCPAHRQATKNPPIRSREGREQSANTGIGGSSSIVNKLLLLCNNTIRGRTVAAQAPPGD